MHGFCVNGIADAIVQGNWGLVACVVVVLAAAFFVSSQFNSGQSSTSQSNDLGGIGIVLIVGFICIVLWKFAANDEVHHAEKFVGHTFDVEADYVLMAGTTEQGMWEYETSRLKDAYGTAPEDMIAVGQRYGVLNIASPFDPRFNKGAGGQKRRWRFHVLATARTNTSVPVVRVSDETNGGGYTWWIPARLLTEFSTTKYN